MVVVAVELAHFFLISEILLSFNILTHLNWQQRYVWYGIQIILKQLTDDSTIALEQQNKTICHSYMPKTVLHTQMTVIFYLNFKRFKLVLLFDLFQAKIFYQNIYIISFHCITFKSFTWILPLLVSCVLTSSKRMWIYVALSFFMRRRRRRRLTCCTVPIRFFFSIWFFFSQKN